MANTIILKKSSTASKVPLATDLQIGELAVNLADQKLYSKNASGTVVLVGSGASAGGDVVGPSSATDNAVARFNTTTGKLIQNSVVTIDDTGNQSGILSQTFSNGTAQTVAAGKFWYDDATGSWNMGMGGGNITQQVGEELFRYGKASAAINDSPLQLVYKTGAVGASGVITFAPAVAGITDSDQIIGIATEPIANNAFGRVTTYGVVHGITTNGSAYGETWVDNQDIYYNPVTGGLTKTLPTAPGLKVLIGTVINAGSGGSGSFIVKLGNAGYLSRLSDVQVTSAASGNTLIYDGTSGYWKNANLTAGTAIAISSAAGAITITNNAPDQVVGLTGAGTTTVTGTYPNFTITTTDAYTGTVTAVSGTSPVTSTGGNTPAIGLASGYGDTQNPYASKTANYVLAAPNGGGAPVFRALTSADIPTLNQNTTGTAANITATTNSTLTTLSALSLPYSQLSGTVPTWNQNTTGTAANITATTNSTLTTLSSLSLPASQLSGAVAIANGGTGSTSAAAALTALGAYPASNPNGYTNNTGTVTSVSGTGTVSGLTLSGTVTNSGSLTLGGAITGFATSGANTNITSVALTTGTISTAPSGTTDIVNKAYADSLQAGTNYHQACNYGTTAALSPANTYNNGTSGVGATLTGNSNGTLTIDGYTFVSGDVGKRILVKNEAAGANNGIYTLTQAGTGSLPYILTRATDYDQVGTGQNEIAAGDLMLVLSGTANANTQWIQQTPAPITIGTTAIAFVQFGNGTTYVAGTGLTLTGSTFSITNQGTANTYGSASQVPVFTTNAQGQVTAVTNTSIAITGSAVTGNIAGNAANVTGTVAIGNGGTGQTSFTANQIHYGSFSTSVNFTYNGTTLAVAGAGTGSALTLTSSGSSVTQTITDTGVNGANIKLTGNGATTPSKYMRAQGGNWQIINDAYSAAIFTLSDAGAISASTWNGATVGVAYGGTGQTTYIDGQLLIGNTTGNTLTKATLTAGSGISITNGSGSITIAASGGAGVTSVTGTSPVVSSGGTTPAISLAAAYGDTLNPYASKTANTFLAAPNGSAAAPTFRAIVAADIPTLNQNTTGTATNATNVAITNDAATATNQYVTFTSATSGNAGIKTHSTGLLFVPSTGALTASGNVTAFSDERVKTNWRDLPNNFIDQLVNVKYGIYDRTDMDVTQVGVSAQSLQKLLGEAVIFDAESGNLSVAYGNAAMVAVIKLAERVIALEAKLEQLTKG